MAESSKTQSEKESLQEKAGKLASAVASADAEINDTGSSKAFGFLRTYNPEVVEPLADTLNERFHIDLNTPLTQFNSRSCQAFAAKDTIDADPGLLAMVTLNGLPHREQVLSKLKSNQCPFMLSIVAYGIVKFSQTNTEQFVIIFERPKGKKLSEYLKTNTLNTEEIRENILAPITTAINYLQQLNITHGYINLDNIYIGEQVTLGPCVCEPCGYSQDFRYETVDRMQCIPAGKGAGDKYTDHHAMAVLALSILIGEDKLFKDYPNASTLIRAILRDGRYAALIQRFDIPEVFRDLFRGIFTLYPHDQWDYSHLKNWLSGKRFYALSPPPPTEGGRPFEFMDTTAHSRRELAHLLASDWENIVTVFDKNQLAQWAAASLRNKDLSDQIITISRTALDSLSKNKGKYNNQITRLLMLLDQDGPLRVEKLALHIDGIQTLFAELYNKKANKEMQTLAEFIRCNAIGEWVEDRRAGEQYTMPDSVNDAILKQDRIRPYITKDGLGFGLERFLYDLNPTLPCLSPLLEDAYIITLQDLLIHLDSLAPTLAKDNDPIDAHIAGFIASKTSLTTDSHPAELASNPLLSKSRSIIALRLLSSAQVRTDLKLPGLTHWLALRLIPALEPLHSRTIRREIKRQLISRMNSGYTQRLAKIVINPSYATADQTGYEKAIIDFRRNQSKIDNIQHDKSLQKQQEDIGNNIARIVSYAAFILSLVMVMQG